MSRQTDQKHEDAGNRRRQRIGRAVDGGLAAAVQADGQELLGFAVRLEGGDCLLTLRGYSGKGRQVCFVGAADLGDAILKAVREARGGDLRWRKDKYAK